MGFIRFVHWVLYMSKHFKGLGLFEPIVLSDQPFRQVFVLAMKHGIGLNKILGAIHNSNLKRKAINLNDVRLNRQF